MRHVFRALVMGMIVAACWFTAVVRGQQTSQTPAFRASIALVPSGTNSNGVVYRPNWD